MKTGQELSLEREREPVCFSFLLFFLFSCRIDGINTTVKSVDLTVWPANCGGDSQRINFLEHVLLVVSFNYTTRKFVEIEIEAPSGTKSLILPSGIELQ